MHQQEAQSLFWVLYQLHGWVHLMSRAPHANIFLRSISRTLDRPRMLQDDDVTTPVRNTFDTDDWTWLLRRDTNRNFLMLKATRVHPRHC